MSARPYDGSETTGFMSPARDHADGTVDLSAVLDLRKPSRYPVRVSGASFASRGILDGDVLVVDAATKPMAGSIVVAVDGDDVVLAIVEGRGGRLRLRRPGGYIENEDVAVWGVAVSLVRDRL